MMARDDIDLTAIAGGTVTSPAGCGKTHLIATTLTRHVGAKPILVLTHTNAGVVALRGRLDREGVPPRSYRLCTIDGWAMRLISMFPRRSARDPDILRLDNPSIDYPNIRVAAARLLEAEHVSDILAASYDRIIVDEYQDCSIRQHAVIAYAARVLPTCALGDPLQAIFGFGIDQLAAWDEDVCVCFPPGGELSTPWRWINAEAEPLGRWLLKVRAQLLRHERVDLRTAPAAVTWVELDGKQDHQRRLIAARATTRWHRKCPDHRRQQIRRKPPSGGEPDPRSSYGGSGRPERSVSFASTFDLAAPNALERLAQFAQRVMTNVGAADLVRRVQFLMRGTARNPPTDVERSALAFVRAPSHLAAVDLLVEIGKEGGVRTHRPSVLRACIQALQSCGRSDGLTFHDAAIRVREQYRLVGRPLPKRAVGSTLLLKGLEAEMAVILDAGSLDARNLYVAMTRGSRALTICSRTPLLEPY